MFCLFYYHARFELKLAQFYRVQVVQKVKRLAFYGVGIFRGQIPLQSPNKQCKSAVGHEANLTKEVNNM